MKSERVAAFVAALMICHTVVASEPSATAVYKMAKASIFRVVTKGVTGEPLALGSAVAVGLDLLVTNYHVVRGASSIEISNGDRSDSADVVAFDEDRDLALLHSGGLTLSPLKLGKRLPKPGEKIFTLGNPKGLDLTLSDGIVSSIRAYKGDQAIQITAPISPGSSGGALLSVAGEVLGITTFQMIEGQNLNFAIPAKWVSELLNGPRNTHPAEAPVSAPLLKGAWALIHFSGRSKEWPAGAATFVDLSTIAAGGAQVYYDEIARFVVEGDQPGYYKYVEMVTRNDLDCAARTKTQVSGTMRDYARDQTLYSFANKAGDVKTEPVLGNNETFNLMCKYAMDRAKFEDEVRQLNGKYMAMADWPMFSQDKELKTPEGQPTEFAMALAKVNPSWRAFWAQMYPTTSMRFRGNQ